MHRPRHRDHQNPPQKDGFFYFTGVVAKQVAREGFSGEMWVCLNLNDTRNNLYRPNFVDYLQIPFCWFIVELLIVLYLVVSATIRCYSLFSNISKSIGFKYSFSFPTFSDFKKPFDSNAIK